MKGPLMEHIPPKEISKMTKNELKGEVELLREKLREHSICWQCFADNANTQCHPDCTAHLY